MIADEIHAPLTLAGRDPHAVAGGLRRRARVRRLAHLGVEGVQPRRAEGGAARHRLRARPRGDARGCRRSASTPACSACSPPRPPSATATSGSTPCSPGSTPTATLLGERLAAELPEIGWTPPEATYLAWLDCRALGLGDDPAAAFLERGRVALSPGLDYGRVGAGFARLNFGTSPELVAEAVARMRQASFRRA